MTGVDHRPLLERRARLLVNAALIGIGVCALAGGLAGAELALAFTRPHAPRNGAPT